MLNEEICKLRNKLNESIEKQEDYNDIYKISVELDQLIAKFYKEKLTHKISQKGVQVKRKIFKKLRS